MRDRSPILITTVAVLAVLGLAIHDDTHEVKSQKKEEIEEWQKYADGFRTEMTAAAAAFRSQTHDRSTVQFTWLLLRDESGFR